MSGMPKILMASLLITAAATETPDPPLSETRLTVHALVREDIFAGLLENDMPRLARAEEYRTPAPAASRREGAAVGMAGERNTLPRSSRV